MQSDTMVKIFLFVSALPRLGAISFAVLVLVADRFGLAEAASLSALYHFLHVTCYTIVCLPVASSLLRQRSRPRTS